MKLPVLGSSECNQQGSSIKSSLPLKLNSLAKIQNKVLITLDLLSRRIL
jgi:hypothetical protein